MSTTSTTSAQILHHTTAFLAEAASQPDLRHRHFTTFLQNIPSSDQIILKTLNLAAETLENALSTTKPSLRSSSLRLAEKLLIPYPENPFSSFLLSLIYHICRRPVDAALCLIDVFQVEPSLARSEIAPFLYEELFLIHFLPVHEWYNEERSKIMSSLLSVNVGYQSDDQSVVISPARRLSNMSGDQALEFKYLERCYEKLLDENCRVFVGYFKEILRYKGRGKIDPPSVVLQNGEKGDEFECRQDEKMESTEEIRLQNGRYNPMWTEEDRSIEHNSSSRNKNVVKYPSFVPERVSAKFFRNKAPATKSKTSHHDNSESEIESSSSINMSDSDSDSDSETESKEKNERVALLYSRQSQFWKQDQGILAEPSCYINSADHIMEDVDIPLDSGKHTPPKDFVCPITSNIFDDPVTLETGQTYERKAIQEWLERGNSTCPITRQRLHNTQLPKTNYVLKRLIASWKEENSDLALVQSKQAQSENKPEFNSVARLVAPKNATRQATIDGTVNDLRLAIASLCTSEILEESEMAVLQIEQFWQESTLEVEIQNILSKPPVISAFVEILFNSVDLRVLKATVFVLSELVRRDNTVIQTLMRVESDVDCVVALFKKGLLEAVVLIYLLQPSTLKIVNMEIVDSLLTVLRNRGNDLHRMCMKPTTASVILLRLILRSSDEETVSEIARRVVSAKAIESIVASLGSEITEERISAVVILLRCILEDGKCRNIIADKVQLAPILENFIGANDEERFEIVRFLFELVKLNRRTVNERVLHDLKDEGIGSTMHTLLIYLQTALQYQCPIVAGLLLQLDLLAEPRNMSIYREEAIDALISCLRNSEFPSAQIAAAETILSLQGRFSSSGKPLTRAYLLKRAGLGRKYESTMQNDKTQEIKEEDEAAEDWDRKMASVLVSHEFGLLFEALSEGLKSRYAELCSLCFVSATWLVHMLSVLPDTGVRGAARVCLLKRFVSIFKSAKDTEDKALSMLALSSFIGDPEGLHDLTTHMKDIVKVLRELKKTTSMAFEMLRLFSEEHENSSDLWNHKELFQEDCSANGEVLSIFCLKGKFFSGHSDGTIKVWTITGSNLHLIHQSQEHTKAVTGLTILKSAERLYSGSLDKTMRVWSIENDILHCEQVYEMKDHVNNLVVADSLSCFIPQGAGIKVHSWNGASKLLNSHKYAKSLALLHSKLYCGCHDNSIQAIDLPTGTLSTIQSGSRKILAKASPVYALQVHDGLLYAASSSVDGTAVKIWSTSNDAMVGSLPSTMEVRAMAISSELIYLGGKGGTLEVWCQKKHNRVETLQTGTSARVNCLTFDEHEEFLVIGTSDGRIQVWGMN